MVEQFRSTTYRTPTKNNVCECSKCKMACEETELIWVEVDGKMKLLCRNCKDLVL